jgi:ClpP class serine protease
MENKLSVAAEPTLDTQDKFPSGAAVSNLKTVSPSHLIAPADNQRIASQVLEQWLKERRSESRWRLIRRAITVGGVLFFAILYGVGFAFSLGWRAGPAGDVVGVVRIEGEISASGIASVNRIVPALQQAYESRNVKAVVISIDVPAGRR